MEIYRFLINTSKLYRYQFSKILKLYLKKSILIQIKKTLNELDQFLKQMEPDIEKITGEERDTATFMKIMRMFNEVDNLIKVSS